MLMIVKAEKVTIRISRMPRLSLSYVGVVNLESHYAALLVSVARWSRPITTEVNTIYSHTNTSD